MTEPILPVRLLGSFGRAYADPWSVFDGIRADRGSLVDATSKAPWAAMVAWGDHIHCPFDVAAHIVDESCANKGISASDRSRDAALLAALAAWRPTQSIYRFDPEMRAALESTPIEGELPADVLRRLPEWCVCLELGPDRYAFVHHDAKSRLLEDRQTEGLCIVIVRATEKTNAYLQSTFRLPLHNSIRGGLTYLSDLYNKNYGPASQPDLDEVASIVTPIISLVLYLCVSDSDIRDARGTARLPQRAVEKTTKKRHVPFVQGASGTTIFETGYRMGAALRRARAAAVQTDMTHDVRKGPIAHVRRAHWHTVLSGPRSEERIRELRWFPPIPVNLNDPDELVATIRPVKP